MIQDPETGYWHRPELDNLATIIKEQKDYKHLTPVEGEIVLDIGAHIGVFSRQVLEKGAAKVIAVEADPGNCEVLAANKTDNMSGFAAACTSVTGNTISLFLSGKKSSMHSVVPRKGRKIISVPTVAFKDLLEEFQPTIIKIDIEGGEFDFYEDICQLPEYVKGIAIEMHYLRNEEYLEKARKIVDYLDSHYIQRKKPNVSGKYYQWDTTVGVWYGRK